MLLLTQKDETIKLSSERFVKIYKLFFSLTFSTITLRHLSAFICCAGASINVTLNPSFSTTAAA